MTFSDSKVVKLIKDHFEPAWEAVAPVRIVTFDLGEGRSLKGTISGEIALYFCTPEGKVFDILPALQSPAATRIAMEEALAFYNSLDGKVTAGAVLKFHRDRLSAARARNSPIIRQAIPWVPLGNANMQKTRENLLISKNAITEAEDEATGTMRTLVGKSLLPASTTSEEMTIVKPGGRGYYRWEVDQRFTSENAWSLAQGKRDGNIPRRLFPTLKSPSEWSRELFETILQQPLKGGEVAYDSDSLEAIRIIGE